MLLLLISLLGALRQGDSAPSQGEPARQIVTLPPATRAGSLSVEEALRSRRSVRAYTAAPLTLVEISQLLWAAQGLTGAEGGRTAPSAGALYPLELYVAAGNVTGLQPGIYRYRPGRHDLIRTEIGDRRSELAAAALGQRWVAAGAAILVFTAVYERTTVKYGDRGLRYVHMEVGHAAQNVYLQATTLHIGSVFVGAFRDEAVAKLLELPDAAHPLGLMPLGRIP
jgi:SagB-type dehydrogenase family enzyme